MSVPAPREKRRRRGGRGEQAMVPDAEFTSYYGRPVVKASPWEADIPAYLFLGGLAAGSSLLAAGADLTGDAGVRRPARVVALGAITVSFAALVHDLGTPSRFHHMLRVAKVTSPMSVGTWLLSVYGPAAGAAAVGELLPLKWSRLSGVFAGTRVAGVVAALVAPTIASYTAVLLSDTATPAWHDAHRELPFVFIGSAAAASGGASLLTSPNSRAPRRLAVSGAVLELAMTERMEHAMGLSAETLHQGRAGRYTRAAKGLTAAGAVLAAAGARSRAASTVGGALLVAGSACTRFGIFHAGQQSALDPRYTVVPQRERVDAGRPVRSD